MLKQRQRGQSLLLYKQEEIGTNQIKMEWSDSNQFKPQLVQAYSLYFGGCVRDRAVYNHKTLSGNSFDFSKL